MRPVTTNANPTYQIPQRMQTNKQAIRNGLAANGVLPIPPTLATFYTEEVLEMLGALTFTNRGAAKWANLSAPNRALAFSLINYFSQNATVSYGNARAALIANYGQYCNYCGMSVQDSSLAVEHRLPKSEFPSEMLTYDNFFLACPICNSYKGSLPTYLTSKAWAISVNEIPTPTFDEIKEAGYDTQIWPNDKLSYKGFTPSLYNVTTDVDVPLQNALDVKNLIVNTDNNTVQATIPGYNKGKQVTVAVRFVAVDKKITGIQENNFIKIVNLNFTQAGNYSDRRVTNRTKAWMDALLAMRRLENFTPGSDEYNYMVTQIISGVQGAGYYSIWAYVFYQKSPPTVKYSVYSTFKIQTTDPTRSQTYFPGTNGAYMP